jgi:hypothetical protein
MARMPITRPVNQNHPAALRLDALCDGAVKIANRPGDDQHLVFQSGTLISAAKWQSSSLASLRDEPQRQPVIAPALTRGWRSVIEQMPVMTATAHAVVLGPRK